MAYSLITRKRLGFLACIVMLPLILGLAGCKGLEMANAGQNESPRLARTLESYEQAGKYWGKKLWAQGTKPTSPLDMSFVHALIDPNNLDYFKVHSDLKEAFKKGFRLGYEDRIADLVLGPHIRKAAAEIGEYTSRNFVDVITAFEEGWACTLKNAVDIFIVLISEGSLADREDFINAFTVIYRQKYDATQEILRSGSWMTQTSEGGTVLYLDYSKGRALGALDIPSPQSLKTEIYHQTFKVMGDEWGRRYKTNLIKRDELIDLLRRTKPALKDVPGNNLGIIYAAFVESFGPDGKEVFIDLIGEAGYDQKPKALKLDKGKAGRGRGK